MTTDKHEQLSDIWILFVLFFTSLVYKNTLKKHYLNNKNIANVTFSIMGHLHILYINSNSSGKDIWNLKQIHKVLFRCKIYIEFQICFQIFDRMTG